MAAEALLLLLSSTRHYKQIQIHVPAEILRFGRLAEVLRQEGVVEEDGGTEGRRGLRLAPGRN